MQHHAGEPACGDNDLEAPGGRRSQAAAVIPSGGPYQAEDTCALTLTAAEADILERAAQTLSADPRIAPVPFCAQARRATALVPERIRDRLTAFSWSGAHTGYLLITGLPLPAQIPPTPPDNRGGIAGGTATARVQAIIDECVGHTVGYEAEGYGMLFQDVVPNSENAESQTSLSSTVELELHTEQAFSPLFPDFLSLACLRGASEARTYLFSARVLCDALTEKEQRVLRQHWWTTTVDESVLANGKTFALGTRRGPMPILSGAQDDPFIVFDYDLMRGATAIAESLRVKIQRLYLARRIAFTLAPGQLLLIDNRRAMHGRSSFAARHDGTDRFVSRSFITADPARTRHARPDNARVIAAVYS